MKERKPKRFHFSKGNKKLSKKVLIWNLPAISTCPGSSTECRRYCYALKAQRLYPFCLSSRNTNLEYSKSKLFVHGIIKFLGDRKETIIRIHESGDFYCEEYLNRWCEIISQLREKTFYAYTKSYFFDSFWRNIPENLKILQSVESRFPQKIDWNRSTARVIDKTSDRKPNEFICPEQLGKKKGLNLKCGEDCKLCFKLKVAHVCFIRH